MSYAALVHCAAEPGADGIQRCLVCGAELANNGPNVATPLNPDGSMPQAHWWEPGASIAQLSGQLWLMGNESSPGLYERCSERYGA